MLKWFGGYGVGFVLLILFAGAAGHADESAAQAITPQQETFFETKIRPLLANNCTSCHGEGQQSAGLRVDSREALLKGGASGTEVVPGNVEASRLIKAVSYSGALKMPPMGKLKPEEIAALSDWVKMGAPWPDKKPAATGLKGMVVTEAQRRSWPFAPFSKPAPPHVKEVAWCISPIDRFVLAKLEEKKLKPAPTADRRTLIRRVTYDLIGLPPTPSEVDAFVNDRSPNAWAKVVDRLLADPRYGERWGRHWLDVVRYADSNGLDENKAFAYAYRYRDYVVNAFNADKPYNEFIKEQIAGDLLPSSDESERNEHLTATGFLVLGAKVLAEQDKPKMVMDIVDEQIEVTSKAFLGLTVACARCHDHKFDPIPTRDYYALAGIFKSTQTMRDLGFVSDWNERPLMTHDLQTQKDLHDRRVADLKTVTDRADKALLEEVRHDAARYLTAGWELARQKTDDATATALAARYGIRAGVLKQWASHLKEPDKDPMLALWASYARLSDSGFASAAASVGMQAVKRADVDPALGHAFATLHPASLSEVADRYAAALVAIDTGKDKASEVARKLLQDKHGLFILPDNPETDYAAADKADYQTATAALKQAPDPNIPIVMAVEEGKPENCRIHIRGSTLNLGEEAPRRFLTVLGGDRNPPIDNTRSGRLDLAEWIARPDHPLTGRVAVNRVWQEHFGAGLIRTPENFGKLGEKPLDPELLDWLAATFTDSRGCNWSFKKLHRLILLSNTYKMSVVSDPKAQNIDPDNRLLSHFNRRRLEAEPFRDATIFVAGDLDPSMGGSLLTTGDNDYVTNDQSADAARYNSLRRSVYLPIIRNALFDMFQAFDYGDPTMVNAHRATTTVAPQALYVLNSPFVLSQARVWATALLGHTELPDERRIDLAFQQAFARHATKAELTGAAKYLKLYADQLKAMEPDAGKRGLKAWQSLCQALYAANEFIYVN